MKALFYLPVCLAKGRSMIYFFAGRGDRPCHLKPFLVVPFDFLCFRFFYRNGEANDPLYGFRIQVTLIDNQACDIESTCLTRNGEFPLDDKSNNETDEKRYGELFTSSKPSCQIQNVCG